MKLDSVNAADKSQVLNERKKDAGKAVFRDSFLESLSARGVGSKEQELPVREAGAPVIPGGVAVYGCGRLPQDDSPMIRVEVKNISFAQSDRVKVDVVNGYVMKGKLMEENAGVYVEAKYDDGRQEAYEVPVSGTDPEAGDMAVLMAFDTVNGRG